MPAERPFRPTRFGQNPGDIRFGGRLPTRAFAKEALGLESTERLPPKREADVYERGDLIVLSRQGEPALDTRLSPASELMLRAVTISTLENIALRRHFDDHERDLYEPVETRLESLDSRVRAALTAWGEATDHLGLGGAART